jgi:hypothetical protein
MVQWVEEPPLSLPALGLAAKFAAGIEKMPRRYRRVML